MTNPAIRSIWLRRMSALVLGAAGLLSVAAQAARPALVEQAPRPDAPAFELKGLDGRTYRLEDYRGHPVVVNFWATWCAPCLAEMPSMGRAQEALRETGVVFLAVNAGEEEAKVREAAGRLDTAIPVLLDPGMTEQQRWNLRGMPTTFVLDGEGRIAYRAEGGKLWDSPRLLDPIRALARPAGMN